jgi:hypothetical protein
MSNILYDTNIDKASYVADYFEKNTVSFEVFRYAASYRISDEDLEQDEKDNLSFETRIVNEAILKQHQQKHLNNYTYAYERLAIILSKFNLTHDTLFKFNDKQMIYVKSAFKKKHNIYGIIYVDKLLKSIVKPDNKPEQTKQQKMIAVVSYSLIMLGLVSFLMRK